jgi:hypothetical protein
MAGLSPEIQNLLDRATPASDPTRAAAPTL